MTKSPGLQIVIYYAMQANNFFNYYLLHTAETQILDISKKSENPDHSFTMSFNEKIYFFDISDILTF